MRPDEYRAVSAWASKPPSAPPFLSSQHLPAVAQPVHSGSSGGHVSLVPAGCDVYSVDQRGNK